MSCLLCADRPPLIQHALVQDFIEQFYRPRALSTAFNEGTPRTSVIFSALLYEELLQRGAQRARGHSVYGLTKSRIDEVRTMKKAAAVT